MNISFFIITLNEENHIEDCLKSIAPIASEIVIVDSASTDSTLLIARKFTSNIHTRKFDGYAAQKNYALSLCKYDWVFSIDADERLTEAGHREILRVLGSSAPVNGYLVPRKNFFTGQWLRGGGLYPDESLRLFKKSAGTFPERMVHEMARVQGRIGHLRVPMIHLTCESFMVFFRRQCAYARYAALEMKKDGKSFSIPALLFHPLFSLLRTLIIRRGFIDGRHGLIYAIICSYYTFLKYAFLWEISGEE